VYCAEGVPDIPSFKERVESLGLTGLKFQEIWNEHDGGKRNPLFDGLPKEP
jgi:hypothetical protein